MIAKEYIPIYATLIVLALIYIKSKKKRIKMMTTQ